MNKRSQVRACLLLCVSNDTILSEKSISDEFLRSLKMSHTLNPVPASYFINFDFEKRLPIFFCFFVCLFHVQHTFFVIVVHFLIHRIITL